MRLSEYLRQDLVMHGLAAENRSEVLRAISNLVRERGLVPSEDLVYEALLEREEAHTTALGNGVAVPHAVLPSLGDRLLVVVSVEAPVAYGPGEGDATDLFFVLLSPPGREGEHIKLLARICRLARHPGFLDNLRAATTREELYGALIREDSLHV